MRRFLVVMVALALIGGAMPALAQESTIHLRLGHFSPGMGQVDVYIDRQISNEPALAFGTLSDWFTLPAGEYRFTITRQGMPLAEALVDTRVDVAGDQWMTLAIVGEVSRGTASIFPLVEDYSPIAPGTARVTFLHAVPDLGLVDIAAVDGAALVSGLVYPGADGTDGAWNGSAMLDVVAGAWTLSFEPADMPGMSMLHTGVTLAEGVNHLVVLAGLRASPLTILAATVPETRVVTVDGELVGLGDGDASVRAGHFASGAGDLDVFVDGTLLADAPLGFGATSEWASLPAGLHEVAVAPAGATYADAIVVTTDVPIATGSDVTLAVVGLVAAGGGQVYPLVEDTSPLASGEARLTVFHAMPDLGPVSAWLDGETLLFVALDFPGIDGPPVETVDLVAGPRSLRFAPYDNPEATSLELPSIVLTAGTRNIVVVAGLQASPATFMLVD